MDASSLGEIRKECFSRPCSQMVVEQQPWPTEQRFLKRDEMVAYRSKHATKSQGLDAAEALH